MNKYDMEIPCLGGPDIQLTQATMEIIPRIGEKNDQNAMLNLPQVFHLTGPRKAQLIDTYAWIAMRGTDGDKFVTSRRARNCLVPNWGDLVKDWEEFGNVSWILAMTFVRLSGESFLQWTSPLSCMLSREALVSLMRRWRPSWKAKT